ncbi:PadR family transcriptional regulator [Frigidibacter sp. RF13]|uniref:PadR family transcriptional regulator n=1 Tax=Frigidibacter sp. RF13 TaxID=2997340 RepID=UPI003B635ED3
MTDPTLRVLDAFLSEYPNALAGADFINSVRIFSGTLYPILDRLERAGWIEGKWEEISPSDAKRPRRRYYSLTGSGRIAAIRAINERDSMTPDRRGRGLPIHQGGV